MARFTAPVETFTVPFYTRRYSKTCKECRAEILCVEAEDAALLLQGKDDNENTRNLCRQDLCVLL